MLSNIAAGSPYQLSQLVNTSNLIPSVLEQVILRFLLLLL